MEDEQQSLLREARNALQQGQFENAMQYYQQLISENPTLAEALHWLGVLEAQQGDYQSAANHIQQAIKNDNTVPQMHNHLGNVYSALKEYKKAHIAYRQAIALDINFADAYNNLGNLAIKQEQVEQAVVYYEQAIACKESLADAHFNLGNLLLEMQQSEKALAQLGRAKELMPEHPKIHWLLARAFVDTEQVEQAIKELQQLIERYPDFTEAQQLLAICLIQTNRYDDARPVYETLLVLTPYDSDVSYNLAVIATLQNRVEEAINYYIATLRLNPSSVASHINIGNLYLTLGEEAKAIEHFQQVLSAEPHHEAVQYLLHALLQNHIPERAPQMYIENLFDYYAANYEKNMREELKYQVPEFIENVVKELTAFSVFHKILDLGCGSGLCAEQIKQYGTEIIGVDLSEHMLVLAKEKQCYSELVQSDILEYLNTTKDRFDLIIAGDVMNYFGELEPVFKAIPKVLNDQGYLIMNTEIGTDGYQLQKNARYQHDPSYVLQIAERYQLTLISQTTVTLRTQMHEPVQGSLFVFQYLLR